MTYLTVKLLAEKYEGVFSENAIRRMIFHEHENGLHKHVRRVGRKVLIVEDGFEQWMEEQNEHA